MLLKNNKSKKELFRQIKALEEENNRLNGLIADSSNGVNLNAIEKFLNSQKIDILIYSIPDNKFRSSITGNILNFLNKIPEDQNSFISLFNDEDKETIQNYFTRLKVNQILNLKTKLIEKNEGSKEKKHASLTVFKENDNNIIFVLKDISDYSKQTKDLIRFREKAEESDKLKSILLANISHQIRTPLNSITGFAEILAASGELDLSSRKDYIDIIKRQSKRILNLIDNISEINKLEAGEINISKTSCNLNLLLNELYIGLKQQIRENFRFAVELKLSIPNNNNTDVITDSGRIQQILLNIINFCQRNTSKGQIEFGYNLDHINQCINFFVKDSSEALSKEEQRVLFKRFLVIDNLENGRYEDPGLGLTIASEITKAMGGKIWVESEKKVGNSFYFNIPLEISEQKDHEVITDESNKEDLFAWGNKVVLIVDDEDVNTIFIEAVLQETSVQTLFAKNGLQALELVKNINKIDLILMDLKMPVMNGIKATQEIRKINQQIPIIAQTALASEEDKEQCKLVGCNDIITKPIEVMELLHLLNSYLTD